MCSSRRLRGVLSELFRKGAEFGWVSFSCHVYTVCSRYAMRLRSLLLNIPPLPLGVRWESVIVRCTVLMVVLAGVSRLNLEACRRNHAIVRHGRGTTSAAELTMDLQRVPLPGDIGKRHPKSPPKTIVPVLIPYLLLRCFIFPPSVGVVTLTCWYI